MIIFSINKLVNYWLIFNLIIILVVIDNGSVYKYDNYQSFRVKLTDITRDW
jgi:hypothetical protein